MKGNHVKPEFVTFTGIDTETDLDRVIILSERFPVEWGILFSPKRQGLDNRYPDLDTIRTTVSMLSTCNIRLAAHICGGHSTAIMKGEDPDIDTTEFGRAQINTVKPNPDRIVDFGYRRNLKVITQHRGVEFPEDDRVQWLYDCSGGRGESPDAWPRHPGEGRTVGYAGGLRPENVSEMLTRMDTSGPFWIDMENGVRTDDWLDLDKCEEVLRAVYGVNP